MQTYNTKEFAAAIGCSYKTVQNWRTTHHGRPPKFMPARREGKDAIYTEEQIPLALALLSKKDSAAADVSVSLFGGSENVIDLPAEGTAPVETVDETPANTNNTIDMSLYNTFMLWAEKISNGQHDAVYPFVAKLKEAFAFDADKDEIINAIKTEDLNGARRYLSQFNFVVKDDAGYSYKLVTTANGECVLVDLPAAATVAVVMDAPIVEETANETDGSEDDDFAEQVPVFIPAAPTDDELIDPPADTGAETAADGEDLKDARAVFTVTLDKDTVLAVTAPVADAAPIKDLPVADAAPIEDLPVADAAPIEDLPVVDTAPIEDLPVVDTAPIEDLPVVDTAPIEDLPVVDTADQHEQENINQPLVEVPDAPTTAADVPVEVVAKTVLVAGKDFLPMTITPNFDAIPQAMKDLRRWLCWKLQPADPKPKNQCSQTFE